MLPRWFLIFLANVINRRMVNQMTEKIKISLQNNFMFTTVFEDEKKLRELLKRILPDVSLEGLTIIRERTVDEDPLLKGIRLDICAEDGSVVYIVEMQVRGSDFMPKRGRYYHSMNDMRQLNKIDRYYSNLKATYVIIISPKDMIGDDIMVYTYRTVCLETGKVLDDERYTIYLNCSGKNREQYPELVPFCDYVLTGDNDGTDEFVEAIDKSVQYYSRNPEWKVRYMEMKQHELEWKEMGKAEERRRGMMNLYAAGIEMTGSAENAFRAVCDKYPEFTAEEIRSILSSEMNESIAEQ